MAFSFVQVRSCLEIDLRVFFSRISCKFSFWLLSLRNLLTLFFLFYIFQFVFSLILWKNLVLSAPVRNIMNYRRIFLKLNRSLLIIHVCVSVCICLFLFFFFLNSISIYFIFPSKHRRIQNRRKELLSRIQNRRKTRFFWRKKCMTRKHKKLKLTRIFFNVDTFIHIVHSLEVK